MKGNTLDSRQLSLLTDLDLQERFINKESNPKYSEIVIQLLRKNGELCRINLVIS